MLLAWLKKTDFNTKVTEIEGKIPSITGLATNSELTAAENKIHNVSSLVKKTDYNRKISEIENKANDHNHDKCITTPEYNTLAADVCNARLAAQTDLIKKKQNSLLNSKALVTELLKIRLNTCLWKINLKNQKHWV